MGEIADAANETFRDFVVDGLPASGPHEPEKSGIRALFGLIDEGGGGGGEGVFGTETTRAINSRIGPSSVPADGPVFIGVTGVSDDGITIDSGSNFPPGMAYRKYRGTPGAPTAVAVGDQIGYNDYRGYSGTEFWNCASIDAIITDEIGFTAGNLPPAKLRFATASDNTGAKIRMEISPTGRVDMGHLVGDAGYSSSAFGNLTLWVNNAADDWCMAVASQPDTGAGYALRTYTKGETSNDYLLAGTSGAGSGTFKFSIRGNGDFYNGTTKVLGAQGAAVADATDAASAITQLNALLARMRAHGLIAT